MPTFEPITSKPEHSFAYYGENEGWLVTLGQSRDSDQVERSNFQFISSSILTAYPDDAAIERMSHWAVGWVEYLLVRPGSPAVKVMSDWREVLDIYPIANDEHYEILVANEEEGDDVG